MIKINSRIDSPYKRYLYGFDYFTRGIFFSLACEDIYINGFAVEDNDNVDIDIFLNKKILRLSNDEFKNNKFELLCLSSDEELRLKRRGYDAYCVFEIGIKENIIIYGAGKYGKIYYDYLERMGINVEAFCDSDMRKVGTECRGKRIISTKELIQKDCNVLIGIFHMHLGEVRKYLENHIGNKVYYTFNLKDYIYLNGKGAKESFQNVYTVSNISYILESKKHRDIYLFGNQKNIIEANNVLKMFDINIDGVAVDYSGEQVEEFELLSPYDLIYSKSNHLIVYVLNGFEQQAAELEKDFRNNKNIFFVAKGSTFKRIGYEITLDVNNGYNMKWNSEYGIVKLGNGKGKKIAVLGGSTSDARLYPENTWPEILEIILKDNGKDAEILCGAVQGYTISQEIVKLLRDVIPLKPDMLILYSGLNDASQMDERYSQYYQDDIYKFFEKHSDKELYYGTPTGDRVEYWNNMVGAIRGICDYFGIKLFVFTNPTIYTKKHLTRYEKEVVITINDHFKVTGLPMINNMERIRKKIASENKDEFINITSTLFDRKDDFYFIDSVHLTTEGNAIIANEIYKCIEMYL